MSHTDRRTTLTRRSLLTAIASTAGIFALAGCASGALAHQGLASLEVFDRDTLIKAGIERADAFVAATSGDNSNIVAARVARAAR